MKNNRNVTISHLYKDEDERWNIQNNEEHTAGVAFMSKSFAAEFGLSSWGELIGKMHDRGKERNDFQKYIRSISGYDDNHNRWDDKTHSWIGAKLIQEKYRDRSYILSNAIAGHHRGLYDIDNLEYVINNDIPPEVDTTLPEIKLEAPKFRPEQKDITHLTRMLFSCLVDADYLDTERFMNQSDHSKRLIPHDSIKTLKTKLDRYLQQLAQKQPSELNEIRNDIQRICRQKSDCASGFYQLTVPTGGGKTIASVIWAINHALNNGKKRVVIAIPFTSIIVQTAQILRDIFGEENVLEHHSVVADENITDINRLASENWDMPIIVTTNVQLFESIFSNKPSKCRKLHSLCDSVIILDEAQSLPVCMLQPIVNAMQSYARMFKTSFLFCTASQPVLDHDFKGLGTGKFKGIQAAVEPLIDESMRLHEKLRRVDIKFLIPPAPIEKIASDISVHDQILCIVNTRRLAAEIYDRLVDDGMNFHLSRMMCPLHIRRTIEEIKGRLKDPSATVRVVSTQLIEAGVDIDFPAVFRQISGLDSILQAAGRCNREAKADNGIVDVFDIEGYRPHGDIKFAIDSVKTMMSRHDSIDWFSPESMREYYEILYSNTPDFDKNKIGESLDNPFNAAYEEGARRFKMIQDTGIPVIVNYGDAEELIKELKSVGVSRQLFRRLGQYTVTINKQLFDEHLKAGLIETVYDGIFYMPLASQYDSKTGLKVNNEYIENTFII